MMPQYNQDTQQQQLQMQPQPQQKATKVTKVRRTRQPRNPQLSVARRNERERNRVKMVNNAFALLRLRIPVEDLQRCEQVASPDSSAQNGQDGSKGSTKAKKFSKVETLRAAIQYIKTLEESMRSVDSEFESMNIIPGNGSLSSSQMAAFDEEPLSVCEPLSCGSSNSTSTTMHLDITGQQQQQQHITYQPHDQFIKLEPHQHPQHHQQNHLINNTNLPSPQNSQTSSSTTPSQQYQTQVQHTFSPSQHTQVEPNSLHTHLWIQQHQSSFMEQQQLQYQQQQQQQWYNVQEQSQQIDLQQETTGTWYAQSETPTSAITVEQQAQQVDQKVWFTNSPGAASNQSNSQQQVVFTQHHHLQQPQQHKISLYSQ